MTRHRSAGDAADDGRPSPLERAVDRMPFLEKELFLLRHLVHPGDICLDVGAAGGAHLLVMARQVGAKGRVIGFEPRPRSLRALQRIVELSGMADRVRLMQVALGDREGVLPLRIPVVPTRAHFHGSSTDRADTAAFSGLPSKQIDVRVRTLDEVAATEGLEHVEVVKCDVEGAELLVLAGASEVLRRFRPIVLVEADDLHQRRFDATAQDVVDAVVAHGYRAYHYRRGALEAVDGAITGEDDYVFVPIERASPLPAAS